VAAAGLLELLHGLVELLLVELAVAGRAGAGARRGVLLLGRLAGLLLVGAGICHPRGGYPRSGALTAARSEAISVTAAPT
jgi:hypothetical protein